MRPSVEALDKILGKEFKVLDSGFVRVIDYMGDDNAIVQSARVSYGTGTKSVQDDRNLIRYLMRHRHSTPFEMCEIKFHVKLPIFIARQWIRHRTANVNEYSARYSILDQDFYLPDPENIAAQSAINNQGRGTTLSPEEAHQVLEILRSDAQRCYRHYVKLLNEPDHPEHDPNRSGIARELARMNLTLNTYTQWYWKIDLHNLLHFLALRADSHAQQEIREYANVMINMVKEWVPHTYEAFLDYKVNSAHLSAQMLDVVRRMLKGEVVDQKSSGLGKREWTEMNDILKISQ